MSSLLIIGAGQYGMVAKEVALATVRFDKVNFLDDNNSCAVGSVRDCEKFISEYDSAFVAIGNPVIRLSLMQTLAAAGYKLVNLIHPSAWVSRSAELSEGIIAEPMSVIHTAAKIGRGCIISAGAVVNHNATLCDGVHVDCNATVAARATVPEETKILSNTVYTTE